MGHRSPHVGFGAQVVGMDRNTISHLQAFLDAANAETDKTTVAAGVARWTDEHVAKSLKPKTQAAYHEAMRRFLSMHAETPLVEITVTDVSAHFESLSPGRRSADYSAFASCWNWLDANGHAGIAGALLKKRYKSRWRTGYVAAVDHHHLFAALAMARARNWARKITIDVCQLLTIVPLRLGEGVSLQHSEVDAGAGIVRLADSKTGPRYVPLGKLGASIIAAQPRVGPYVFAPPRATESSHIGAGGVSRAFRRICKKYQEATNTTVFDGVCLHSLRHSWASYAGAQGVPLLQIQKIMGHTTATMLDRYSHITSPELSVALDSMQDKMLGQVRQQMALGYTEVR